MAAAKIDEAKTWPMHSTVEIQAEVKGSAVASDPVAAAGSQKWASCDVADLQLVLH
jgi:hypothetical protein